MNTLFLIFSLNIDSSKNIFICNVPEVKLFLSSSYAKSDINVKKKVINPRLFQITKRLVQARKKQKVINNTFVIVMGLGKYIHFPWSL